MPSTLGAASIDDAGTTVTSAAPAADVLRLFGPDQISDSAGINLQTTGLLYLNGFDETIGPLSSNGGSITTGAGLLALNGDVKATSNPNSDITGNLDQGTPLTRTFTMALDGILTLDGPISGAGNVVKAGLGTLINTGILPNT